LEGRLVLSANVHIGLELGRFESAAKRRVARLVADRRKKRSRTPRTRSSLRVAPLQHVSTKNELLHSPPLQYHYIFSFEIIISIYQRILPRPRRTQRRQSHRYFQRIHRTAQSLPVTMPTTNIKVLNLAGHGLNMDILLLFSILDVHLPPFGFTGTSSASLAKLHPDGELELRDEF
jgi:hypothetical protein